MSKYPGGHDYEADRLAIKTIGTIPIRSVARYLLYDSHMWDHVIDVLNQMITPHARARTRSIKGSYDEVMQAIACLGIPTHTIPAKKNGDVDVLSLSRWVDARKAEESYNDSGHRWMQSSSIKRDVQGEDNSVSKPVKRRKMVK